MTDQGLTVAEALSRFLSERHQLLEALEGFSEEELTRVPMLGEWTVRDLLAHILAWEEEAVQRLKLLAAGRAGEIAWVTTASLDSWNARFHEQRKELSLAQVKELLARIAQELEGLLASLPEALLADGGQVPLAVWFPHCTYAHAQEHREQILAWQRELETTEG